MHTSVWAAAYIVHSLRWCHLVQAVLIWWAADAKSRSDELPALLAAIRWKPTQIQVRCTHGLPGQNALVRDYTHWK